MLSLLSLKCLFNLFMFLDPQGSFDQKQLPVYRWPQIFDRMNSLGLGIHQQLWKISCFCTFLLYFFETFQMPHFNIQFKQFCLIYSFFCFWLWAQKCVETCVNYVLKVQPFFLNLSSRVLPEFRPSNTFI